MTGGANGESNGDNVDAGTLGTEESARSPLDQTHELPTAPADLERRAETQTGSPEDVEGFEGTTDNEDAEVSKRPLVAVVSLERTASQSVYHSLRATLSRDTMVMHSHFVGETPWRETFNEVTARKEKKELSTFRRLQHSHRRRVVFTVLREAEERICSIIWYRFAKKLEDGGYQYATDPKIQTEICVALDKQIKYHALVYQRIGAVGPIRKGRNDLPNGVALYVLRFGNLANDFRNATIDAFGEEIPLLHINTAEERSGDPKGYRNFTNRFNLKDALYTILRERYGLGRHVWANDIEPGLLGLSDRWVSVLAAAVVKDALDN